MQLGYVTAILPDWTLEQHMQFAAKQGFDCLEVMCWPVSKAERRYAGVTHLDVTDFTPAAAAKVNALCAAKKVALSGLGYYPNPLSPNADEAATAVEHIRRVIRATHQLGLKQMNTFVGRDWTKSIDDNWPRFLQIWQPIVQFAEEQAVCIGIENCPMLFSQDEWPGGKNLAISPKIWHRMFAEIPSPNFGLNFDPSHLVWQQMDYLQPLRTFAEKLFHVHAKDVRVDRHRLDEVGILAHPLEYHVPKLPGFGDVEWGKFFSVLTDVGFRGAVCVEVEDRAYEDSLESRLASLRQSATYLRNFIPRRGA